MIIKHAILGIFHRFMAFCIAMTMFVFTANADDTESIQSVTVYGLTEQVGTPTPTSPVDIHTNNGVLRVKQNLFDKNDSSMILNGYIASGSVGTQQSIASSSGDRSFIIKVKPNTKYTIQKLGGAQPFNRFRIADSANMPAIGNKVNILYNSTAETSGLRAQTVTTSANANYLIVYGLNGAVSTNLQTWLDNFVVSEGDRINIGTIYTDGTTQTITDSANHTANVATLLGVGDYRDTQNINTGAITRNVGVAILKGTEVWNKSSTYTGSFYTNDFSPDGGPKVANNPTDIVLTHGFVVADLTAYSTAGIGAFYWNSPSIVNYKYDDGTATVAQFTQWLATQYAAGTPVIVVYPLATPTTESVAGQTMTMAPVSNATGGVNGMTITTLLSGGREIVTNIVATGIKIATRAYNTTQFAPVVSALNTAIDTIKDVVTNTINQTAAVSALQSTKQTRPDDGCPQYRQCLLVEDSSGTPHWYEILDPFYNLFATVIPNNVSANDGTAVANNMIVNANCRIYTSEDGVTTSGSRPGWLVGVDAGTYIVSQTASNNTYVRKYENGTWSDYVTVTDTTSQEITLSSAGQIYVYGGPSVTIEIMQSRNISMVRSPTAWSIWFGANSPLDVRYNVAGSAKCNNVPGTENIAATSAQIADTNWTATGDYCWCSIDKVSDANGNIGNGRNIWAWLEIPSGMTCAADCAEQCAITLQNGTNTDFRHAITGI